MTSGARLKVSSCTSLVHLHAPTCTYNTSHRAALEHYDWGRLGSNVCMRPVWKGSPSSFGHLITDIRVWSTIAWTYNFCIIRSLTFVYLHGYLESCSDMYSDINADKIAGVFCHVDWTLLWHVVRHWWVMYSNVLTCCLTWFLRNAWQGLWHISWQRLRHIVWLPTCVLTYVLICYLVIQMWYVSSMGLANIRAASCLHMEALGSVPICQKRLRDH